jgi:D-alanine transaminase
MCGVLYCRTVPRSRNEEIPDVMSTVFLNGEYVSKGEARISVDDRGFLFGDGVYEVTPAYRGSFFLMDRHLARMRRGLRELRIAFHPDDLLDVHHRLLDENDLRGREVAYVYVQITRGVAPRTHAFPAGNHADTPPSVYAFAKEYVRPPAERWDRGYEAITVPDRRWARVDIKTINLLPNCMAQQAAVDAGVTDALLVKDGMALEGSHNNFFTVVDGTVVTHPATNVILHGITRGLVLELCEELGIPVDSRPLQLEELWGADEAFFTGTTTEIRPTVRIDGRTIGDGRPGPVTRRIKDAFLALTDRTAAGADAVERVG